MDIQELLNNLSTTESGNIIAFVEGKELNSKSISDAIKGCNVKSINQDTFTIMTNLLPHFKYDNISSDYYNNEEEIVGALEQKILEYKIENNIELEDTENKDLLPVIHETNEDLKRIKLISTSPSQNDSNEEVEYIIIKHVDGLVDMLVCDNPDILNDYLENNSEMVITEDAESVFNDLKKYADELKFKDLGDDLDYIPIIDDPHTKEYELNEINNYISKWGLEDKIEVCIDPNGERLYRIKNNIIKFIKKDGKRILFELEKDI